MKKARLIPGLLILIIAAGLCSPAMATSSTIEMPVPEKGESLYTASAEFDQADSFLVAFILSEDGSSIHSTTVFMEGLNLTANGTKVSISSSQSRYNNAYPIEEGKRIEVGDMKLYDITFQEDGNILATMEYTYTYRTSGSTGGFGLGSLGSSSKEIKVPLGTREMVFEKQP